VNRLPGVPDAYSMNAHQSFTAEPDTLGVRLTCTGVTRRLIDQLGTAFAQMGLRTEQQHLADLLASAANGDDNALDEITDTWLGSWDDSVWISPRQARRLAVALIDAAGEDGK